MALMFYLLDKDMNIKKIIENYKSAIWTERFYESGDFELYIPATVEDIEALNFDSQGRTQYICRADDTTRCGMIESVNITTDAEEGNFITVKGRTLEAILFRRVVLSQVTFTGSALKTIEMLIKKSLEAPTDARRAINNLTFKNSVSAGTDQPLSTQYSGDNVGEAVEAICKTLIIGYRANFDLENKAIELEIYEGTDRTTYQSAVPPVIFSNDFNNLLSSSYGVDVTDWKNNALVVGEGEGTNRMRVEYGGGVTGIERREMYLNAQETSTNGDEISPSTYNDILYNQGYQAISENRPKRETEADVAPNYGFKLNQDYFIGDEVTVENEYGIQITPRVVEVIEAQDDTGYSIVPTFALS